MTNIDPTKMINYLREKWAGRPCPLCAVGNWTVQTSAFELRQFYEGNMVLGGPIIPVVPVVCTNCGNTVLVNALIAGVVTREPEAAPPPVAEAAEEAKK
jgi:hypothetical protein